jgi:NAD-dependent deacetylase
MTTSKNLHETISLLKSSKKTVALTGAGISVDSGIQPFRGKNGLWEKYNPGEYAHITSFILNPEKSWIMLKEMGEQIFTATPNPAHISLTKLQKKGYLDTIITQNVDNFHQEAGNSNVIEFHGNFKHLSCINCGSQYLFQKKHISSIPPPPKCICGMVLKPDVVLYGETPPIQAMKHSEKAVLNCDILIIIGTSATVYPAANLPITAKKHDATIIEINMIPTHLTSTFTDLFL